MADQAQSSFGWLLRQLRIDAALTQEELAEAAKLSVRSVSDLERGINLTARKETARLLADALALSGSVRAEFEALARGRRPPGDQAVPGDQAAGGGTAPNGSAGQASSAAATAPWPDGSAGPDAAGRISPRRPAGGVAAATRTLPRDIASFTGRGPELAELMAGTAAASGSAGVVGIHAIDGMAGIGKSAFAVHAAHQLAPEFPDGQIFLHLHGHTPGQRPVDPADALASLLQTAGVAAEQIPPGLEARTRLWRDYLAGQRLLIVLDDAAGHDQVRPLLPGTAGSLVLVTSRRHLTALEDAREISLDTLPAGDAAGLLIRLADRPDLDPGDPAVARICELCGYLPLAIGMLASRLHSHRAWTAADLAADLAAARDHRLELMLAENLSVAAAFDLSYQDLSADQQRLFRRLGLLPGTDVDAYAAAALDQIDVGAARRQLEALYDQNLLTEPARGRYRPHDLIREHARDLAHGDPPDQRIAAVDRLLDYYLHTARVAGRLLARRNPAGMPALAVVTPAHAPELSSPTDAVAWMDAERLNLHAAADYAGSHDRSGHATAIPAAMYDFLRSRNHWEQAITLHRAALEAARSSGDQLAEAGALAHLGDVQRLTGDFPAAAACSARALELYHDLGSRLGEAGVLTDLSAVQRVTGDYPGSAASLARALELYRDVGDRLGESSALTCLGLLQRATGNYPAAVVTLDRALALCRELGYPLGEAHTRTELSAVQRLTGDYPAAIDNLATALERYRDLRNRAGEANALTDLGLLRLLTGDPQAAVSGLEQATAQHRAIGHPLGEVNALNYLGAAQSVTGDHLAAFATLERARELSRDLGYRFGEITALNNMGEALLATGAPAQALPCYEEARSIAAALGTALEEACALEGIGRCDLQQGRSDQAVRRLSRALAIYSQLRSPNAERVAAALAALEL